MEHAYYVAMNVAWAYEDAEAYRDFYEKLTILYDELIEAELEPIEPEAPKTEL